MLWFNPRKTHFKRKLDGIQKAIWDGEFSREKLKMLREDIRRQYDRLKETDSQVEGKLTGEEAKEKPNTEAVEQFKKLREGYAPDLTYLKQQMDGIDNELAGDGNAQSVTAKLEALRQLKEMVQEYMKRL